MKKFLSVVLVVLTVLSLGSLVGCGDKEEVLTGEGLKFGMGVYSYVGENASATAEKNGKGEVVTTVAAVLLDKDGKILKSDIDSISATVEFTSTGTAVPASEFKTKREPGDNYGMVAYGNAKDEWYKQVDNFEALAKGKTFDEVKALMVEDGKGNDDVIKAGCTINIADFVKALEKAVNNATKCVAMSEDEINVAIIASQGENSAATAEADGKNGVTLTVAATTVNKDKKVTAARNDELNFDITFDSTGAIKTDLSANILTKFERGESYGMVAYGNAKKEWFEQSEILNKACIGKTSKQISALAAKDGTASEELQTAGCTIAVSEMVKALVKSAK